MALNEPGSADVKIGGQTVAKWRFDLIKDEAPHHQPDGQPDHHPRGALRLVYRADDDHGVANAEAKFALAEGEHAGLAAPPIAVPPPVIVAPPSAAPKDASGKDTAIKTDPLLEAAADAAAIVARQREARRGPRHARPDCPPLGRASRCA